MTAQNASNFENIIKIAKSSPAEKKRRKRQKIGFSRLPEKVVRKKLWDECRRIIRARDRGVCFTCGATGLIGGNAQTGHFIPSSVCGVFLRYDLRNLALQCMVCNVHRGGMGATFYRNLVLKHGQDFVDEIFKDKNRVVKARDHMEMLLEKYKLL